MSHYVMEFLGTLEFGHKQFLNSNYGVVVRALVMSHFAAKYARGWGISQGMFMDAVDQSLGRAQQGFSIVCTRKMDWRSNLENFF